jgi:hypothetical protein
VSEIALVLIFVELLAQLIGWDNRRRFEQATRNRRTRRFIPVETIVSNAERSTPALIIATIG